MNKNLFLAFALCATLSSSLVVSMDSSSSVPYPSCSEEPEVAAPSLYSKLTTLKDNPLRVSTHFPVVAQHAGSWTPCVDAACGILAGGVLVYGLYSNKATLKRGGKSLASGVATAASATKSGVVSVVKAIPLGR